MKTESVKGIVKYPICALLVVPLLIQSSCAVTKNSGADSGGDGTATAWTYQIEEQGVSPEGIIQAFFGMSIEEAKDFYNDDKGLWVNDGRVLVVSQIGDYIMPAEPEEGTMASSVGYWDNREGAYECYSLMTEFGECMSGSENFLTRANFPEEELDSCTKEEAVEACRPYAEGLGYTDENSVVSTYAVTLDMLQEKASEGEEMRGYVYSAPDPDYVDPDPTTEVSGLVDPNEDVVLDNGIPWEKKHEAILVEYQTAVDGGGIGGQGAILLILYVPMYGYPVMIQGTAVLQAVQEEEKTLISEEEALEAVITMNNYDSADEMESSEVSLVYKLQGISEEKNERDRAIPCWEFVYFRNGKSKCVLIDAVYGDEYVRYPAF